MSNGSEPSKPQPGGTAPKKPITPDDNEKPPQNKDIVVAAAVGGLIGGLVGALIGSASR